MTHRPITWTTTLSSFGWATIIFAYWALHP